MTLSQQFVSLRAKRFLVAIDLKAVQSGSPLGVVNRLRNVERFQVSRGFRTESPLHSSRCSSYRLVSSQMWSRLKISVKTTFRLPAAIIPLCPRCRAKEIFLKSTTVGSLPYLRSFYNSHALWISPRFDMEGYWRSNLLPVNPAPSLLFILMHRFFCCAFTSQYLIKHLTTCQALFWALGLEQRKKALVNSLYSTSRVI